MFGEIRKYSDGPRRYISWSYTISFPVAGMNFIHDFAFFTVIDSIVSSHVGSFQGRQGPRKKNSQED